MRKSSDLRPYYSKYRQETLDIKKIQIPSQMY